MRLTVLIIGLLLGAIMFVQAVIINILTDVGNNEAAEGAAAAGVLVALLWLLACAFVMPFPLLSTFFFIGAGLIAFAIAGTSEYEDMAVWGGISLFLALLSFFGWRGKRKDRREQLAELQRQRERDVRLEGLLTQQNSNTVTHPRATIPCPNCGYPNTPGTKFCSECGTALGPVSRVVDMGTTGTSQ